MLGCGEERNEKESMKSKINLTEQHQRTARMRRNVAIRNATRKKRIHKKKKQLQIKLRTGISLRSSIVSFGIRFAKRDFREINVGQGLAVW